MTIKLCKIKKDRFDELKKYIIKEFESTKTLSFPEKLIESYSEPIIINGKYIEIEIDLNKYLTIINKNQFLYAKQAEIAIELHKDIRSDTTNIPRSLFYEKEFWAYLSLTVFKDVVIGLRDSLKKGNINADKIKQFYFNTGEISRTGLLFLWSMVDRLDSKDDNIIRVAFEFIDPVKAVLERTMSKNPDILRAFVQGIINNNNDSKFKSDKFRSRVPSHISCYASVSVIDALDYNELVDIITKEQYAIISEK